MNAVQSWGPGGRWNFQAAEGEAVRRTGLRNLLGRFWNCWPRTRPTLVAFLIALPATAWILYAAEADKSASGPATYDAAEKESIFAQLKSATSKPIDALAASELAERIDELLAASWRKDHIIPAATTSDAIQKWRETLAETGESEKQDAAMFDRELFYAIQPRERLMQLIEQYAEWVKK